jgi:copper chaperone CopZ
MAVDGVTQVRINPRARSITVNYDPARLTRSQLLTLLEECGCVETAAQTASTLSTKAGEAFGKALIGAVVNKAIERSAVKFVSVLL